MTKLQFGLLFTALLAIVAMLAVPRLSGGPSYEYRVIAIPDLMFESGMKTIGDNGWDLVSARRAMDEHKDPAYEMIFRRTK